MRRRGFVGALGAALAAVSPRRSPARQLAEGELLLALAEVVVPDRDPSAWREGPVAAGLLASWDCLEPVRREKLKSALNSLDQAAVNSGAGRFTALDKDRRNRLTVELIKNQGEFSASFAEIRTLIIRAFYDSPLGCERTGYRPTTQFKGYPEYAGYTGKQE